MPNRRSIMVCGHFGGNQKLADGQTVKTQTIFKALKDVYGDDRVFMCDTYQWKKNPFHMLFLCIKAAKNSDDVVLLPADKGVFVFIPLFSLLGRIYKTNIHYSVIGGWLADRLRKTSLLKHPLKSFASIQVETEQMKTDLEAMGVDRVHIIPNFKTINALDQKSINRINFSVPLPLCTFSRVMKEKGIEDAIKVVTEINANLDSPVFTLDIYGAIDNLYKERFEEILKTCPKEITYKGVIDSADSVKILKNYYLLLFPTHYFTEGLPGTIIDSYAAGVPVLSAKWESFSNIIKEGSTGFGFKVGDNQEFSKILLSLIDTNKVLPLKKNCIKAFEPYSYKVGSELLKKCIEETNRYEQ